MNVGEKVSEYFDNGQIWVDSFEKKNNISINLYTLNFNGQDDVMNDELYFDELKALRNGQNRTIVPSKVNKGEKKKHVVLLLIDDHYVLITNPN